MKRLLKSPAFNAGCISLFTAFYAIIFLSYNFGKEWLNYEGGSSFWNAWSGFLSAGHQAVISWVLIAVTIIIVFLLIIRRRPYDEYHTSILTYCLVAASVLTLAAIGIFFLVILIEPVWAAGKFTLFIIIHWITIVLANFVYVLLCRWR